MIGGGEIAYRKIQGLLEAGARVRVVDPDPLPEVKRLAAKKRIALLRRLYRRGDLGQSFAAIASTDDRQVNLSIHREAKEKNILLNIVDKPEFCSFVFPARISRGEFLVTISTGGASPAFSKKVREDLEGHFGPEYGILVEIMTQLRRRFPPSSVKGTKDLFTSLVRSPILESIRKGNQAAVDRILRSIFGDGIRLRELGCKITQRVKR